MDSAASAGSRVELGAHLARRARRHLGALGGAPEPEQRVGGALGQRGEQVDLRSDDPGADGDAAAR